MRILKFGSTGPSVSFLQTALIRRGYGGLAADGVFGALTRSAVTDFQRASDLPADGIAGRLTHNALMPWYLGFLDYTVRPGDTFYTIARRYGSGIAAIETANPDADGEKLRVGSKLTVPLGFDVVPTDIDCCSLLIDCCVMGLSARYPFLTRTQIGKSVMGRPLWRLGFGTGENRVLFNASHHANEWITTTLLLKFTEELCKAYAGRAQIASQSAQELFAYAELALIPAVNPDGIDLAAGELQSGEYYDYARRIALDYPQYSFPTGWKANIRGIDPNLQYPAGWEQARENKYALGIRSPAPADFVGGAPLTAPEPLAVYDFTRSFLPALTLSYHTQGEVIYWKYLDYLPPNSRVIADAFAAVSGYAVEDTPYASGFAGYKDWYIAAFDRPGYTIEAGKGVNPLPLAQFNDIYNANLGILTLGMIVT